MVSTGRKVVPRGRVLEEELGLSGCWRSRGDGSQRDQEAQLGAEKCEELSWRGGCSSGGCLLLLQTTEGIESHPRDLAGRSDMMPYPFEKGPCGCRVG